MARITRDQALMASAQIWSQRSTCSRAQVGAVVSRQSRILITGYNGSPSGMKHCNHECNCFSRGGGHYDDCPSQQPCVLAVHAEANVVAFAAKHGVSLDGATLHTTRVPCTNCAMLIINAGITRVVWHESHRDMGGLALLNQAELEVVQYDHEFR